MGNQKKFVKIGKELIRKLGALDKEQGEKLLARLNYKLHLERDRILNEAFGKKLMTKGEYENNYKDMFYDEFGFDGFLQYVDGVMNANADYFITINKNLINKRKEMENKFKLRILTPEELEKMLGKNNNL